MCIRDRWMANLSSSDTPSTLVPFAVHRSPDHYDHSSTLIMCQSHLTNQQFSRISMSTHNSLISRSDIAISQPSATTQRGLGKRSGTTLTGGGQRKTHLHRLLREENSVQCYLSAA